MPVFNYKAFDRQAKTVLGIIDADSSQAARRKLQVQGLFPITIVLSRDIQVRQPRGSLGNFTIFTRVRPAEIGMMTRQLATLLRAGFPLVSALESVITQTDSTRLKTVLAQLREKIVEGRSMAEAIQAYPHIFSIVYTNMIRAGETSGTLDLVMERLADISEKQEAMKNRIRAALTYPLLMLLIGSAILFFLMTHVVPNITGIFAEMERALPVPTRILIKISGFLQHYWIVLLLTLIAMVVAMYQVSRTEMGGRFLDRIVFKLPMISALMKQLAAARFTHMLGSLSENGIPMLSALQVVRGISGNRLFAATIDRTVEDVRQGKGLARSLKGGGLLPALAVQMIEVGEQSGALDAMLLKIAAFYEQQLENQLLRLTALLEPLMIVVMGFIVGFIVLSICLPIFEMNQLIM